jgi:hypothetical protein
MRKTMKGFIEEATKKHEGGYSYQKFTYINAKTQGIVTCKKHGDFLQTPNSHLHGNGCMRCAVESRADNKRDKAKYKFIGEATEVHNGAYTYEYFIYSSSRDKGLITCSIHGGFLQTPNAHLNGRGCKECGNVRRAKFNFNIAASEFIDIATKKHKGKYSYNNFSYEGGKVPGYITCPIHGDFKQTPDAHKQGNGCQECGIAKNTTYIKEVIARNALEFIQIAKRVHANKYTYDNFVYYEGHSASLITCPVHGDFSQAPSPHKKGHGCPKCAKSNYSKIAIQWLEEIAEKEGIFIRHAENVGEFMVPTTKLKVDGYCKETNTVYEFHGDLWHGNPAKYKPEDKIHPFRNNKTAKELYEYTIAREGRIKELGYNLVVIWESDYQGKAALAAA